MILIEERNSSGNAFYNNLKQTHEKNYFSCTRPIIDKYWEEDDARRARDAKMGIVRKPRSDTEEKDIARRKEEWERYENRESMRKEPTRKEPTRNETESDRKCERSFLSPIHRRAMNEYETEFNSQKAIRPNKHTKHVKPRSDHRYNPRSEFSDVPSMSVSPKPKPCVSNTEYLRWYNGVKTGALEYNSFAAKPYIEYAKRLTGASLKD